MTSLGSANWRVHPMQEMEPSGASAAISTSSYGGIHMPGIMNRASKSKTETSSSMETAYWSGRRKQLGLSRLDVEKESETTENEKYDQFLKDMSVYVERNFHQKECIKFIPKPNQKVRSNQQLKCHCGEVLSLHVWARSMKEPGGLEKHVPEEFLELARNPTAPPPQVIPQVEWKAECDISPKSSWTYGKVNFNVETSGGKKPAKYLRLSNEDSVDSCLEFMETFWHIMDPYPPNLVISVVGGAKNFKLDGEMRDTFSNGLIKVNCIDLQ
ncbi:hypothetical protein V1264_013161 [Littorina saxatilis]|uniref:TRPM SLOG domain-containing protein n=1 Tax=Littorina saxatilis TaxID=31220 RepID=A0AAN9BSU5_9CAEN